MPPGINAGKVEDLEGMSKKLGVDDGELALMKVDAQSRILSNYFIGTTFKDIIDSFGADLGEQYKPTNFEELLDCMVHKQLRDRMDEVVKGIDNTLLQ